VNDLSAFLITKKWPPRHSGRIQLYSLPTPNGAKVSIMLEEAALAYEPHVPGNKPLPLFESGAILIYLAEKSGQLMPRDAARRYETIQWLMLQMAGIGPMFGQVGFFHKFAGRDYQDKRPLQRYVDESKRLLGVLDRRLSENAWIMGNDYSVADIATFPWIRNLVGFYDAGDLVGISDFANVTRALQAFNLRPAVIRGSAIPT
jgi:GSH-dependent disulfide-bond oxidoreductase